MALYPLSEFNSTAARTFYPAVVMRGRGAPEPILASSTYVALLAVTSDAACGGGSLCGCRVHEQAASLAAMDTKQQKQTFVWLWDYRPVQQGPTGACHGSELAYWGLPWINKGLLGLAMDLNWPTGACHGSELAYWGLPWINKGLLWGLQWI
jgi:hypothetical protein